MPSLGLAYKSRDCWQEVAEVVWPLLCGVRNASEAEKAPRQKSVCVKEQLQQEREMWLAMLASDLTPELDKQENGRW